MELSDKRIYKIIEENPKYKFLNTIMDRHIIIMSPNVETYQKDPKQIKYQRNHNISQQLVVDIISHDDSYDLVRKVNLEGLWAFGLFFLGEDGHYISQYSFSKRELADLLIQINVDDYPEIKERYNEVMGWISFEKFIEDNRNLMYSIKIDGINYEILIGSMMDFINLSDDTLISILEKKPETINGIPSHHFLYAINKFFEEKKLEKNYYIEETIINRLDIIKSSKDIDVQMVNEYNGLTDPILDRITVNQELVDEILKDIPIDFTDLEKAIYVYIKMCKLLTYDEEYYAIDQKGPLTAKHKSINNVSKISLSNNKVVCYEFNTIYSYVLHKLGIPYKNFVGTVDGLGKTGEMEYDSEYNNYSEGHTFLKFRCGKYLVKADSVTTILNGDIMQSKLNQPLKGLKCENTNEESKLEFDQTLDKVYKYIAKREKRISNNEVGKVETFEDILSQFRDETEMIKPISIEDKVKILIEKVNKSKLIGIDAYSYLLQLRKIIFTPQEQKENLKITIIRNSLKNSEINYAEAVAIISTIIPFKDKMEVTRYIFKSGHQLIPIGKEELQAKFDDDSMGYVTDTDPIIPGITR